jgi:hypothetical protein
MGHVIPGTPIFDGAAARKGYALKKMCYSEPDALAHYSIPQLVEAAGTQGVEVLNWVVARAALSGRVEKVHSNYHIPEHGIGVDGPADGNRPHFMNS